MLQSLNHVNSVAYKECVDNSSERRNKFLYQKLKQEGNPKFNLLYVSCGFTAAYKHNIIMSIIMSVQSRNY